MTAITTAGTPGVNRFTRSQLLRTAQLFATDPDLDRLVDLEATERTWRRLDATDHLEIWLISWPVGATTGWHDHLQSEGAFLTVKGELAEQSWSGGTGPRPLPLGGRGPLVRPAPHPQRDQPRRPPRPVGARLLPRAAGHDPLRPPRRPPAARPASSGPVSSGEHHDASTGRPGCSATRRAPRAGRGWDAPTYAGIDDQLSDARSRLDRVSARAAYQEVLYGRALLVDIRPAAQRPSRARSPRTSGRSSSSATSSSGGSTPARGAACRSQPTTRGCSSCARRASRRRWRQMRWCAWGSAGPPTSSAASGRGARRVCPTPPEGRYAAGLAPRHTSP